ncbi:hypothetical protein G9A89_000897 [Geosiphon pyriformis]|nr:hypothetical protein G9A89_000897 [Geosiphon pyriformis]
MSQSTADERIILNVGGVKYETLRSTLTSQPHTLLGKLFKENTIKPTKGNEYFFDRNGRAFHYVLEYYRTGRITLPRDSKDFNTSGKGAPLNHDIIEELNYFEIVPKHLPFQNKALAIRLDEMVGMFMDIYFEMAARMVTNLSVRFHIDGYFAVPCDVNTLIGSSAYVVLEKFSQDIQSHLSNSIPELKITFNHFPKGFQYPDGETVPIPHFDVELTLNKDQYDFDLIRNNSCLRSRDP